MIKVEASSVGAGLFTVGRVECSVLCRDTHIINGLISLENKRPTVVLLLAATGLPRTVRGPVAPLLPLVIVNHIL